jgi:hypothetical protein
MKIEQIDRKWAKKLVNTGFCFSDCLKTVAASLGKHCEFEAFCCYDLEIDCENKVMPEIREKVQREDCLEKYHGLKIINKYPEEFSLSELIELVKKKPAIVKVNSVYCPWDPSYQRIERNEIDNTIHYFVLCGITEDETQFYCCDAYYNLTGMTISVEKIPKMLYQIFYLEDIGEEVFPSLSEFREKAENILGYKGIISVSKIFESLLYHFEEHWEEWKIEGKSVCLAVVNPLCWEMVSFMQRGIYFANMADFYGEKIKKLGEQFSQLSEICERICMICLKCSHTGKLSDKVLDGMKNVLCYLKSGREKEL